jgi:hypothetical protein
MIVNISFDTNNASFEEHFSEESVRVAQQIEEALFDSGNETTIRRSIKDVNGNRIGIISISPETPIPNL